MKLIVFTGQYSVEYDSYDGAHSQTGKADGKGGNLEGDCTGSRILNTDGQHQNQCCNQYITALGEVHLIFDYIPNANRRDHTVEHKADAANGSRRHSAYNGRKLGAEGKNYGKDRSQTITRGS